MLNYTKYDLMDKVEKVREVYESISNKRSQKFIEECKELQYRLLNTEDSNLKELVEISYGASKLANHAENLKNKKYVRTYAAFGSVVMIYVAMYYLINKLDFLIYFSHILISIVGALTYILTAGLKDSKEIGIGTRMVIAVIMPFLLLSIFIEDNGRILQISNTQLLSFAFGYSSELVVLLFNKIIEKTKKAIE